MNIKGLLGNTSIILKANEQTKWTIEVSYKVLKTGKNVGDDLREKYN